MPQAFVCFGLIRVELLQLDSSASLFQLSLDGLCIFLRSSFLNGGRNLVNLSLSFLQAQAGDSANNLDNADLLLACIGQDNVELGLLLSSRCISSSSAASNSYRSSGNAKLFFKSLNQLSQLKNLQFLDGIHNLIDSHGELPPNFKILN